MKLIKLSEEHYIIVNGPAQVNKLAYTPRRSCLSYIGTEKGIEEDELLVTHSTQPLESSVTEDSFKRYEYISLSEIERLVGAIGEGNEWDVDFEQVTYKELCHCSCHRDSNIRHFAACCRDGYKGEDTFKLKLI